MGNRDSDKQYSIYLFFYLFVCMFYWQRYAYYQRIPYILTVIVKTILLYSVLGFACIFLS